MKITHLTVLLSSLAACTLSAQSLMHRYSFDTDASDSVGGAHGTLHGDATVSGGQLVLPGGAADDGHFVELPASTIGINGYSAVSIEFWSTQDTDNQNFSGTASFGELANPGQNYLMVSTSRGDDVSRGMISTLDNSSEPWNDETGMNGPEHNDGLEHHYVLTVTQTHLAFYVDGILQNDDPVELAAHNSLDNISLDSAMLGRGVYSGDDLWRGEINDFRIWDGALSETQVAASFALGPNQVIPEPSTYALIFGALALGGALYIRRRRNA